MGKFLRGEEGERIREAIVLVAVLLPVTLWAWFLISSEPAPQTVATPQPRTVTTTTVNNVTVRSQNPSVEQLPAPTVVMVSNAKVEHLLESVRWQAQFSGPDVFYYRGWRFVRVSDDEWRAEQMDR